MQKRLDSTDIRILEALGVYGPRNILKLGKKIGLPTQTLRDRIKNLKSHFSLLLEANTYHTFIGLKKALVYARATPGYFRTLWAALKANGYWLYLVPRYDMAESCFGVYGIPIDHTEEFEQFLKEIEKLKIAQSIELLWSTCIQTINLTDNWYDHNSECWVFEWDKWIQEIENQGTQLPYTLLEQESCPQKADKIDIIILKELEKNAECKLRDIAKLLEVPPQTVGYHFKNHIIKKGLMEGYLILLRHFEANSNVYFFRFNFHDEKTMAKFALSLMNKPIGRFIGKIFGEDAVFAEIYLPRRQFRAFTRSLTKLIRKGLLKSYDYAIEDRSRKQAQTISYEFFENNKWIYDHEKHLENLRNLVRSYK